MANCRQPLINWSLLPGALASGLLVVVALLAFGSLWFFSPSISIRELFSDHYLWHVIGFTFWQAFLSALFSILPAILLARALYRRRFPGRKLLLQLCAMTLVLPVLVAVFGILSVYGKTGWLSQLYQLIGLNYDFSPYGLQGILLAHVFFNMPLATRMLLQSLENISTEQRQIAAQLGLNEWQQFRILEWPYIRRQMLPTAALIFMLCFASFATVLALGGGPAATTIELAIYQALSYDFDPARAAVLALIQLFFVLV
ncbi:thiamine transporter membrane protein [Providencia sneebia DSM 19967]|uniref:Thiamine transporter membrane protein n=1 Tax=Providencia sneebia DSM 19967 TaxID=1141660 RepID=K8WHR0_9GAMM|nr:thiamine transporter membrane protein [Providencia sneebia DSM 19967]